MKLLNKKVKNTYEAAYYLTGGAKVVDITFRKKAVNLSQRFSTQWIVEMEDIPESYIEKWRQGRAVANVSDIEHFRYKIKALVRKE